VVGVGGWSVRPKLENSIPNKIKKSAQEMSRAKSFDRALGVIACISGGVIIMTLRSLYLKSQKNRIESDKLDHEKKIANAIDEIYSARYALLEKVYHYGFCDCGRTQFRIFAPRILNAFDVQSKIRFPRIVVGVESFEINSDESLLTSYLVTNGQTIGKYIFCSACGVHVLYLPSLEPKEIQANVDCLQETFIDRVNVSYYGKSDLVTCHSYDGPNGTFLSTDRPIYLSTIHPGGLTSTDTPILPNASIHPHISDRRSDDSVSDLPADDETDSLNPPRSVAYSHSSSLSIRQTQPSNTWPNTPYMHGQNHHQHKNQTIYHPPVDYSGSVVADEGPDGCSSQTSRDTGMASVGSMDRHNARHTHSTKLSSTIHHQTTNHSALTSSDVPPQHQSSASYTATTTLHQHLRAHLHKHIKPSNHLQQKEFTTEER
jgi:hypothetical protein